MQGKHTEYKGKKNYSAKKRGKWKTNNLMYDKKLKEIRKKKRKGNDLISTSKIKENGFYRIIILQNISDRQTFKLKLK